MRKQLTALIGAAAGLAALAASAGPAAAWHNYRWHADYAPLYRPCCGAVYGPAGTYYPRAVYYPGAAYFTHGYVGYPYPIAAACRSHQTRLLATSQAGSNHRSASPS
jgi:hypothetical protein